MKQRFVVTIETRQDPAVLNEAQLFDLVDAYLNHQYEIRVVRSM